MNKPKKQGTAFESALVWQAQDAGLMAGRFPEGGVNDIGDVWLSAPPSKERQYTDIAVVAWRRLVKNGTTRRVPDGEPTVVVISLNDFLLIAKDAITLNDVAFTVECKATQTLNVTRTLADAKNKLRRWKEQ